MFKIMKKFNKYCLFFIFTGLFVSIFCGCNPKEPQAGSLIPKKCNFFIKIDFPLLFEGLNQEAALADKAGAKDAVQLKELAANFKKAAGIDAADLVNAYAAIDIADLTDFSRPPQNPPPAFLSVLCTRNPANDILLNLSSTQNQAEPVKIKNHDFYRLKGSETRYLFFKDKIAAFAQTEPLQLASCADDIKNSILSDSLISNFLGLTDKSDSDHDFLKVLFIPSEIQKSLFTNISVKGLQFVKHFTLGMNKKTSTLNLVFHGDKPENQEKIKSSVLALRMILSAMTAGRMDLQKVVETIKIKVLDSNRVAMQMQADPFFVSAFLNGLVKGLGDDQK